MCTKSPFAVASASLLYVKCEQTVLMGMWKVRHSYSQVEDGQFLLLLVDCEKEVDRDLKVAERTGFEVCVLYVCMNVNA